ncbi:DinB family protein [Gaetbulibacter saemankumensis]|uniref:DinB family protein n=1 Tax=Gaetbulibacter saemankumensis TaxID=311208 RepID=UPI0003FF83C4|nr:DinB family protein [Gaetbulibacter saemankumensis]
MSFSIEILSKTRNFFKQHLETIPLEDLNKIPEGFNNNIIWNIGHIIVTQQLLNYKLSGLPMLISEDLIKKYMKGTKPAVYITKDEVEVLKGLLFSTIDQFREDYKKGIFKNFQEYTVSTTGNTLKSFNESLEFVVFHEGMHLGYVMALLRAI